MLTRSSCAESTEYRSVRIKYSKTVKRFLFCFLFCFGAGWRKCGKSGDLLGQDLSEVSEIVSQRAKRANRQYVGCGQSMVNRRVLTHVNADQLHAILLLMLSHPVPPRRAIPRNVPTTCNVRLDNPHCHVATFGTSSAEQEGSYR